MCVCVCYLVGGVEHPEALEVGILEQVRVLVLGVSSRMGGGCVEGIAGEFWISLCVCGRAHAKAYINTCVNTCINMHTNTTVHKNLAHTDPTHTHACAHTRTQEQKENNAQIFKK